MLLNSVHVNGIEHKMHSSKPGIICVHLSIKCPSSSLPSPVTYTYVLVYTTHLPTMFMVLFFSASI